MQVTELSAEGLKRSYQVKVEAHTINSQIETELLSAGEKVKIPGFRPGFIPMKVLQQRYGKSVRDDVMRRVINDATRKVVTDHKLRPAMAPQIDVKSYEEGGDLEFTLILESLPEVPEVDFSKITLERLKFELEDKHIDEALTKLAERSPQLDAKSGKAETGDVVDIDFKGIIDGSPFEGGTAEHFRLELGSGQFIDGFEDQLVGAKAGDERNVNVRFPEDYHQKQLAGRDAVFEVKVHEVLGVSHPEPNEEFAKARGFSDMRALREAIRDQLNREYGVMVRNRMKRDLFDELEEKCEFEAPRSMFDMEFKSIWQRLQQARASGDPQVANRDEAELKAEYEKIATRRVRLGILLSDIASKNNVQISPEELTNALMQYASMYPGQEKQVIAFYRQNPERLDDLRGPILEEKAVDLLLEKVALTDRNVSVEEMLDLVAEDAGEGDGAEASAKKSSKKSAAKPKAKSSKKKPASS